MRWKTLEARENALPNGLLKTSGCGTIGLFSNMLIITSGVTS